MLFCRLLIIFKINFFFKRKKSFRNTIRMSNSLDHDQARQIVGPDLGPNCLPRISADDTGRQRSKHFIIKMTEMNAIIQNDQKV